MASLGGWVPPCLQQHPHFGLNKAASTAARRRAMGRCTFTATERPRQKPRVLMKWDRHELWQLFGDAQVFLLKPR